MFGGMNINYLLYKNIDFCLVFILLIRIGDKMCIQYPCSRNYIILFINIVSIFSHDWNCKRMLINDWYYKNELDTYWLIL